MDSKPRLVDPCKKGVLVIVHGLSMLQPTWLAGVYLTYVLHHGIGLVQLGFLKVVAFVLQSVP